MNPYYNHEMPPAMGAPYPPPYSSPYAAPYPAPYPPSYPAPHPDPKPPPTTSQPNPIQNTSINSPIMVVMSPNQNANVIPPAYPPVVKMTHYKDYLCLSIFTLLSCFWPIGIAALVFSCKVTSDCRAITVGAVIQ
ncbi:leucine-rich repeat extensin 1 [Pelobates cultripes]|uniref:Leucine-rich repeat extensin 1 n=1 Tax=Pelobates cultripes TaxID=61616 RepID=A0AAD1TMC5_PELCU|nr:leucine-rich repeat extensin 1 [Pelobates cultripes]